jgi:YD repeat-containing protein
LPTDDSFLADVDVSLSSTGFSADVPISDALIGALPIPDVSLAIDTSTSSMLSTDTINDGDGASDEDGDGDYTGGASNPPLASDVVDQPESINAIISDSNDEPITWVLTATPQLATTDGSAGTIILSGSGEIGSWPGTPGQIGVLDPTELPNGVYTITLTATASGSGVTYSASSSQIIQIQSAIQLGNLTLPVTDLTENVPGAEPITVSRSYDSQNSGLDTGLGYGWTLSSLSPALSTTATTTAYSMTNSEGVPEPSLSENDLIYINLPNGQEYVFAFEPIIEDATYSSNPLLGALQTVAPYVPAFVAVDGSNATLVPTDANGTPATTLTLYMGNNYAFFDDGDTENGDVGYNPAYNVTDEPDGPNVYGGYYDLTLDNGTSYIIDAASGMITSSSDALGNTQTFSDGISGTSVTVDGTTQTYAATPYRTGTATSDITSIVYSDGVSGDQRTLEYAYDNSGDLIGELQVNSTGTVTSQTTYSYANQLVLNYAPPSGVTAFAEIFNSSGVGWNGTAFSGTVESVSLSPANTGGDAVAAQWLTAPIPGGIAAGNTLTVKYFNSSGTLLWTETREYNGLQPHDLTGVIDDQGVTILSATYDPTTNQLTSLINTKGAAAQTSNSDDSSTGPQETTTSPSGNPVTDQYDANGNVIRAVTQVTDSGGAIIGYDVTVSQYQYFNDPTQSDQYGLMVNVLSSSETSSPFFVLVARSSDAYLSTDQLVTAGYLQTDSSGNILWASEQSYNATAGGTASEGERQLGTTSTLQSDGTYVETEYEAPFVLGKAHEVKTTSDGTSGVTLSDVINTYDTSTGVLINSQDQISGVVTSYTYADGTDGPVGSVLDTYQTVNGVTTQLSQNVYYTATTASAATAGAVIGLLESSTDCTTGMETIYTYYADGESAGTTQQWVNSNGTTLTVPQGNTTYNSLGQVISSTDAYGNATTNSYDGNGQVVDTTDINGGVTHNVYDAAGNLIQTIYPDGTETRSVYNNLGQVIWQTSRFASSTSYSGGTVTEDNNTTANATETIYDAQGNVIATEQFSGVLIYIPDGTNGTVESSIPTTADSGTFVSENTSIYNGLGQAVETISASGFRTGTIYYSDGQVEFTGPLLTSVSDQGSSAWYSNLPADLLAYSPDPSNPMPAEVADELGAIFSSYTMYAYGNTSGLYGSATFESVTQMVGSNTLGLTTSNYSDAQGQAVATVYPDESYTQTIYSDDNGGEAVGYDNYGIGPSTLSSGDIETVQIAQHKSGDPVEATVDLYNSAGELIDVWQPAVANPSGSGTVNPHTQYVYDAAGNEVEQIDAKGNITTFTYDEYGNQIGETLPDGESDSASFNSLGQETQSVDYDHNTASYTYYSTYGSGAYTGDVEKIVYTGSGQTPDTVTYTYTSTGQEHTVTDTFDGTTTYTYGAYGNQTQVASPQGTVNYVFDPATGLLIETWTGTSQASAETDTLYGYTSQGQLASVSEAVIDGQPPVGVSPTVRYDADGNALPTGMPTTLYTYDDSGNKISETLPNGIVTTYSYDSLNRLTGETETNAGGTLLFSQTYTLNADGSRASALEYEMQTSGSLVTNTYSWSYDALDRLTGETLSTSQTNGSYTNSFTYDLDSNRMSEVHVGPGGGANETTTYVYNNDDEVTSQTETFTGSTTITNSYYDANGSMTKSLATTTTGTVVTHTTNTYTYNVENKMVSYALNGTTEATYVYDDDGNRVKETTGGVTTFYLITTNNPSGYDKPIEQWTSTNGSRTGATLSTSYVIGDQVLGQANSSGAVSYLLADGQDTTRLLTDASGNVTATFNYDAFGDPLNFSAATAPTQILFQETIYDSASGLNFTPSRQELVGLDRFIEQDDPGHSDNENPITLNSYLLDGANPITNIDLNGHDFDYITTLAVAGITTGILGGLVSGIAGGIAGVISGQGFAKGFGEGAVSGFISTAVPVLLEGGTGGKIPPSLAFGLGGGLGELVSQLIFGNAESEEGLTKIVASTLTGGVLGGLFGASAVEDFGVLVQKLQPQVKAILQSFSIDATLNDGAWGAVVSSANDLFTDLFQNGGQKTVRWISEAAEAFLPDAANATGGSVKPVVISASTNLVIDLLFAAYAWYKKVPTRTY